MTSHASTPRPANVVRDWCAAFRSRCRARGLRLTPQRLAVYRELAGDRTHPTADAVHARLKDAMPTLSVATVYRILESFEREGLIRRVSTPQGAGRFDANVEPHQHLVCRACRSVTDVTRPSLAGVTIPASLPDGFVAEEVDIHVVGLCRSCATEAAATER